MKQYLHIIFQHFYKKTDFVGVKSWPPPGQHNSTKKTGGKSKVLSTTLTNYPSIQNFTLLLPLIKEGPVVEGLTIMEYFTAILTGHVPQSQLFLVSFDEDEKPSARPRTKMTLRDRPQTTTTA